MKKEDAEKLVCPFMSRPISTIDNHQGNYETNCITTKCMAWENKEVFTEGKIRYIGEGYCKRLKE